MQPLKSNTIGNVLQLLTGLLSDSPSARLDAEVLVAFACRLTRVQLITRNNVVLTQAEFELACALAARRQAGEPVAHITGHREFYSLDLLVNRHTLIPRPETELLVDLALERIPETGSMRILELGTGSGAIALAIAGHRPCCEILATDSSEAALAVAALNMEQQGFENIKLRQGNWFENLEGEVFDLIISNPPYVAVDDVHLSRGDVRFEPRTSLVADNNGLADIIRIANRAGKHLLPNGKLMLEHGATQADDVATILESTGAQNIICHQDLAGLDRVTTCEFNRS